MSPAWWILEALTAQGDFREADAWLKECAAADDLDAISVLEYIYRDGWESADGNVLVAPTLAVSRRYAQQALALGDPEEMVSLADRLTRRRDKPIPKRALELYVAAWRRGSSRAAHNLACAYKNRGLHREAVKWFKRAVAAGDRDAQFEVGKAEIYGLGTRRDVTAGIAKLERVASSKTRYIPAYWRQCLAMVLLAELYIDGWHVPIDYNRGQRWLRRAERKDSATAAALLGWVSLRAPKQDPRSKAR